MIVLVIENQLPKDNSLAAFINWVNVGDIRHILQRDVNCWSDLISLKSLI